jgi:hypothetical protein
MWVITAFSSAERNEIDFAVDAESICPLENPATVTCPTIELQKNRVAKRKIKFLIMA